MQFHRALNSLNMTRVASKTTNLICFRYFYYAVLPTVLQQTLSLDLHTRHGSLLCAAELTHALYCFGIQNNRFVVETILERFIFDFHYRYLFPTFKQFDWLIG